MPEDQQPQPENPVENATITQAGAFDSLLDEDTTETLLDDSAATDFDPDDVPETLFFDDSSSDFIDVDVDDDDDDASLLPAAVAAPAAAPPDDIAARLAKLEAAASDLANAEIEREARRVKRKVTAATTGAGASGFVPLLLQMLGVYDLDPVVTGMLSTVASLVGAFAAGWITPERTPPLPTESAHSLIALGATETTP